MPINLPFRPHRDSYPPDLWTKCPRCGEMLFNKQLDKALRVCPHCGHHFRLSALRRLELLVDAGTFRERDAGLQAVDALGFVDSKPYPDRLAAAQLATGLRDAAVWGTGLLDDRPIAICVLDFGFIGGSMGAVVGEKVARAAETALAERIPLIVVASSGGARMQEGTYSLMQLVKTLAAIERVRLAGVPYVSILCDPTTGGVFASFAAVGDVNLAEPNALIGFAGERVASGTIAEELPAGFQRAEFLLAHGFVDRIVARSALKAEVSRILAYLVPRGPLEIPIEVPAAPGFRPLSFLSNLTDRWGGSDTAAGGNGTTAATNGTPAARDGTTRGREGAARENVAATPANVAATPGSLGATRAARDGTAPGSDGAARTGIASTPASDGRGMRTLPADAFDTAGGSSPAGAGEPIDG